MRIKQREAVAAGVMCLLLGAMLGGGAAPSYGQTVTAPDAPAAAAAVTVVEVRLGQAVIMALTNNRALRVERLNPDIRQTFEERERALFDPVLSGRLFIEENQPAGQSTLSLTNVADRRTDTVGGSVGVRQRLPTGTEVGLALEAERDSFEDRESLHRERAEIEATQALLRGRPVAVNLVDLRKARLDTTISRYELRGFAETLVADVERVYWEYSLIRRQGEIVKESLNLAEQQLKEIEHRIRVGDLPETELAAAQAEVALRREGMINARSGLAKARLQLLRLIHPDGLTGVRQELRLVTEPAVPDVPIGSLATHLDLALRLRPDLNQARLQLAKGELALVKTRNGLLPRLDLFVTLGDTAYAASFSEAGNDIDGRDVDVLAGVTLEYPLGNREARSSHKRAVLTREQAAEALQNMTDLMRVDVESGYIEVERTREQVFATAQTRSFQEEKVRAETVKFKVGRSTALLVAQAQRDLLSSRVSEVEAVASHLQALVTLYRLEGSLLDRRGLTVSGL
jgi:outer membrane protein TolC